MKRTALIAFICALLCGCSAPRFDVFPAGGVMPPGGVANAYASELSAQTKTINLLYVAAALPSGNAVVMATYPQYQTVGQITTFQGEPKALCVGRAGDVFVTQLGGEGVGGYVYGYHHGSKDPFVRLNDPGTPYGCSVDPTTRDLAIANYLGPGAHGNVGDIAIYPKAHGAPKLYRAKDIRIFESCSYDSAGNLVADGASVHGDRLLLLPHGGRRLSFVPLNKVIYGLGPIQWDGKDFALGYAGPHSLYRIKISKGKATVVRTVHLPYKNYNLYEQFWVQGNTVIAIDGLKYGTGGGALGFWNYPAGGKPTTFLKGFDNNTFMTGVAVSLAPQ